ncbi:hypothetical protein [Geobacter sp. SVR]|uniref:hypothetical protein n=1 Tax=Geobacter sp. SVR TaxID=2495594 RepID=UPI00143EFC73|nr:hypothetical protein [Geobacter sp. SVR]BCS52826.1 hypothetical protein GSVR_11340 [Geobacter sp. SVR]GCF86692.1 hypothetical protein GSbR_32920 [Geobacter sp. SVR]
MRFAFRRIIALVLLCATVSSLMVTLGGEALCAGEAAGVRTISVPSFTAESDSNCPCVPAPSNSQSDQFCTGDCDCPCHAPVSPVAVITGYSPSFDSLPHFEISPYIPEVYLDPFIPPQNLA